MYRILKLVLLVVAANLINCAPTTFIPIPAPLTQQYFYYAPQPQPQPQLQYQPLLKFQQPASTVSRIDAPKEQYVLFYPSVPQLPIMALRQDEISSPNPWTQLTNWFSSGVSMALGQSPAPGEQPAEGSTDMKTENIMMEKNAETIQPLTPASTMPLNKRLFIVSGPPQFYGNFAALQPATISNPILSIQARAPVASIPAENEKIEQPAVVAEVFQQPAILQPGAALQLRSNIIEPLQRLEIEQPQVPIVNNEPVPEVAAQQLARFLEEARSQDDTANPENTLNEKEIQSNDEKLRAEGNLSEEEPSIAQAKPSGIALSGKGGVSSSAPVATAVVGEGGLALASPSAIAVSGDFTEEQEERKMAAMEE